METLACLDLYQIEVCGETCSNNPIEWYSLTVVFAAVSIVLWSSPVISKHIRFFFQFLQLTVEETYFFHVSSNAGGRNLFLPFFFKFRWKNLFLPCIFKFRWKNLISFKFLQIQLEETYFFHEAIVIFFSDMELVNRNTTKNVYI